MLRELLLKNLELKLSNQTQLSENVSEFNSKRMVRKLLLMFHMMEVFYTSMKMMKSWSVDLVDLDMPSEIFQESDF